MEKSIQKMTKSLDKHRAERLKIAIGETLRSGFDEDLWEEFAPTGSELREISEQENKQKLHGLTAEEILSIYAEKQRTAEENRKKAELEKAALNKKYQQINELLLNNQWEEAEELINSIEAPFGVEPYEVTKAKEKLYGKYIDIYDFEVSHDQTTDSTKNFIGSRLAVRNMGDKEITKLVVSVFYKNDKGEDIYEQKIELVNSEAIFDRTPPLKPSLTLEMPIGKYYTVDSPLLLWDRQTAEPRVTEIKIKK